MLNGEQEVESNVIHPTGSKYSAGTAGNHRSSSSTRRLLFFCLASTWGFIVGVVGLLAAMSVTGQHLEPDALVIPSLIPGLIVAAGGGLVVAAAYRESKRRSR